LGGGRHGEGATDTRIKKGSFKAGEKEGKWKKH